MAFVTHFTRGKGVVPDYTVVVNSFCGATSKWFVHFPEIQHKTKVVTNPNLIPDHQLSSYLQAQCHLFPLRMFEYSKWT